MPTLRVKSPGGAVTVYHLFKKLTSVGSSPACDVVIPDPLVAEDFALIHFDGQVYSYVMTARGPEAVINGKRRKKHELRHEDRLVIGAAEPWRVELVDYPHALVRLNFCKVRAWTGPLEMREGQRFAWAGLPVAQSPVLPGALPVLDWLAAERGFSGGTCA